MFVLFFNYFFLWMFKHILTIYYEIFEIFFCSIKSLLLLLYISCNILLFLLKIIGESEIEYFVIGLH